MSGIGSVGGGFELDKVTGLNIEDFENANFDQLIENASTLLSGDSLFFLLLQQRIAQESQAYTALSQVQKNRDDARETTIRNV